MLGGEGVLACDVMVNHSVHYAVWLLLIACLSSSALRGDHISVLLSIQCGLASL